MEIVHKLQNQIWEKQKQTSFKAEFSINSLLVPGTWLHNIRSFKPEPVIIMLHSFLYLFYVFNIDF